MASSRIQAGNITTGQEKYNFKAIWRVWTEKNAAFAEFLTLFPTSAKSPHTPHCGLMTVCRSDLGGVSMQYTSPGRFVFSAYSRVASRYASAILFLCCPEQ